MMRLIILCVLLLTACWDKPKTVELTPEMEYQNYRARRGCLTPVKVVRSEISEEGFSRGQPYTTKYNQFTLTYNCTDGQVITETVRGSRIQ